MEDHDNYYSQALEQLATLSLVYGIDKDDDLLRISRIVNCLKRQHPKLFVKNAEKLKGMRLVE